MPFKRYDVLGVPVDEVDEDGVLRFVLERVASSTPARIVTVNVEFIVRAQWDYEFKDVLRRADLATPDSFGVVWALRRQGARVKDRAGGSDLLCQICRQASVRGHSVFLLGAAGGVAAAAAEKLTAQFPGLNVTGTYAGSPSQSERNTIVHLIREAKADILFVAFGAPLQDIWIAENLPATGAKIGMGVGGTFDYVAGVARRAPFWMQRRGLEWLWRLTNQPSRWRRMLAIPRFVWLVWRS